LGIHSGSVAITRYRVLGLKKKISLDEVGANISSFQARSLRLNGVKRELVAGWVRPAAAIEDAISESDHWELSDCHVEGQIVLRLRVERRVVPGQLMQLVLRERLVKKEKQRSKPISRIEKKEISEQLKEELIDKALPHISYVDACWDWQTSELLLFSTSTRYRSLFEELFRKSFCQHLELNLVKVDPPLLGLSEKQWQGSKSDGSDQTLTQLALTTPTTFAEHSI